MLEDGTRCPVPLQVTVDVLMLVFPSALLVKEYLLSLLAVVKKSFNPKAYVVSGTHWAILIANYKFTRVIKGIYFCVVSVPV